MFVCAPPFPRSLPPPPSPLFDPRFVFAPYPIKSSTFSKLFSFFSSTRRDIFSWSLSSPFFRPLISKPGPAPVRHRVLPLHLCKFSPQVPMFLLFETSFNTPRLFLGKKLVVPFPTPVLNFSFAFLTFVGSILSIIVNTSAWRVSWIFPLFFPR